MDILTFIIVVVLIHCALFFFDTFFKSCSHYPYLYFLHNTGLEVHVLQIRWFTTAFNRFLQKCGSWRPKFLALWFSIGVMCSLALLPVAVYVVIRTAVYAWQADHQGTKPALVVEPMVPGLNLPLTDIGYYVATLLMCSVVHELGHAVAAVREDVHISGIGVTVLLIVPVVYVNLSTEQYEALPARRQLLIICAGVWHNVVLAVAAMLMITLLPALLLPLFESGSGVVVQHIDQTSPVLGLSGLSVGDKIVAVNQQQVKNYETWHHTLSTAVRTASPGYCIPSELVRLHDESVSAKHSPGGVVECCAATSSQHLCFEYLDNDVNMPELPQHSCLPARAVIEAARTLCVLGTDCDPDRHCIKPLLANQTKLVQIERDKRKMVIFLGHPSEIYHTVRVSEFVPKYNFMSPAVAEMLMKLCEYVFVFSSGLAVINVIPCFYFDGQHIIQAACALLLATRCKRSTRQATAYSVTFLGSVLIFGIFTSLIFSALL